MGSASSAFDSAALEMARCLFAESTTALILFDPVSLRIVEMNPAARRLLRLDPATPHPQLDRLLHGAKSTMRKELAGEQTALPLEAGRERRPVTLSIRHLGLAAPGKLSLAQLVPRPPVFKYVASDARFRAIFDQATIGMAVLEVKTGCFVDANAHCCAQLGYTRDEILTMNLDDITHRDDLDQGREQLAQLQQGERATFSSERRCLDKQGRPIWVQLSISALDEETDSPRYSLAMIEDITERKQFEHALRESERRFRTLIANAPVGIHEIDLRGDLNSINSAGLKMLDCREDEAVGNPYLELVSEEDVQRVSVLMDGARAGHSSNFEFRTRSSASVFSGCFVPLPNERRQIERIMGIWEDVTERRQVEQQLRESQESLARAQRMARVGSWEVDLQSDILTGSAELFRILGIPPEPLHNGLSRLVTELVHVSDRAVVAATYGQAPSGSAVSNPIEFRLLNEKFVRSEVQVLRDSLGQPLKLVGTLQDISHAKAAENALRESEAKFRALTDRSPAMVAIIQGDKVRYANPVVSVITGYSLEELVEQPFAALVHPEQRSLVEQFSVRRQRGEQVPSRYELSIITRGRKRRWLDFAAEVIEYEGRPAILGIGIDITQRRASQEQLRQKEAELAHVSRLSTMGELVAGIAHEINQPLYAIANYAAAAQQLGSSIDAEDRRQVDDLHQQIAEQAVRAGGIIRRLRDFVRKSDGSRTQFDIVTVVRDSIQLLSPSLQQHGVRVELETQRSSILVAGDPIQIEQVCVNLLSNALEAMAETPVSQRVVSVRIVLDDERTTITMEDQGSGFPVGAEDHLFDAFFTTKPTGLGMGLAISRTIIESHGGRIWVTRSSSGTQLHFALVRIRT